jgi:hypothetical protein
MLMKDTCSATLEQRKRLVLDSVRFPLISPKAVPRAIMTVPVIIMDFETMVKYDTTMVAGLVDMSVTEEGARVQPGSGWWMLEDGQTLMDKAAEKDRE